MQRWAVISTTYGSVGFVVGPGGVNRVLLLACTSPTAAEELSRRFPTATRDQRLMPELQTQLRAYFAGRPVHFDVSLDLESIPPFRRRVLEECARIPYGETVSYGELARRVGSPQAARAVGGAMAGNPVPILIPCHRVVASSGRLGGFSAEQGVSLKIALLNMERTAIAPRLARLALA